MNSKQAAKAAAKHIEELERIIGLNISDIKQYNACILDMISHKSPCEYCHDQEECRTAGKDLTIGCEDWMLRSLPPRMEFSGKAQWQQDVQDGKDTVLFGADGGMQ